MLEDTHHVHAPLPHTHAPRTRTASAARVHNIGYGLGIGRTATLSRVTTPADKHDSSNKLPTEKCNWANDSAAVLKLIKGSYINLLLIAVPFGFISNYADWNPTVVFFINFFAMMPLAAILGDSTECLAEHLGETVGGLLNATFGNAVEIVVMILALSKAKSFENNDDNDKRDRMILVVQYSLIGSVFSNSLLVLGCSFLAHGFKTTATFNVSATSANVALLMLASFVMILPGPYQSSDPEDELAVSRAAAVILLLMYSCLLVFVLYTHKDMIEGSSSKSDLQVGLLSEEVNAVQKPDSALNEGSDVEKHAHKEEEEEEEDELKMTLFGSMTLLLSCTIMVAILSEFLVGAIEPMSTKAGMTEAFVGMILLPIIGNAVEHITAIRMARKGKMDISLSIAIGSATQVAMFVVGLAVIVGWIMDIPMKLDFPSFEVQMFIYTSIILFALVNDGESNWLEGAMLLCLYLLIAIAVWYQKD